MLLRQDQHPLRQFTERATYSDMFDFEFQYMRDHAEQWSSYLASAVKRGWLPMRAWTCEKRDDTQASANYRWADGRFAANGARDRSNLGGTPDR